MTQVHLIQKWDVLERIFQTLKCVCVFSLEQAVKWTRCYCDNQVWLCTTRIQLWRKTSSSHLWMGERQVRPHPFISAPAVIRHGMSQTSAVSAFGGNNSAPPKTEMRSDWSFLFIRLFHLTFIQKTHNFPIVPEINLLLPQYFLRALILSFLMPAFPLICSQNQTLSLGYINSMPGAKGCCADLLMHFMLFRSRRDMKRGMRGACMS